MDVTVLGSGEAVGVPAPLCGCEYCETSETRRRPGVLVETDVATIVLDVSPDIKGQLNATDTTHVDAFFVTHHHFDHAGGLHELSHAAMGFDEHVGIEGGYVDPDVFAEAEKPANLDITVYTTETALDHIRDSAPHLQNTLDFRTLEHGTPVAVRDLRVVPFPVRHARPQFDTLGFAVYEGNTKIVYAPDMWEFMDDEYADADLLIVEGAALFRTFGHGEEADLRDALEEAAADQTILLNLNEHLQRLTTDQMRRRAAADGYELGEDFASYRV